MDELVYVAFQRFDQFVEDILLFFLIYDLVGQTKSPFIASCQYGNRRYDANVKFKCQSLSILYFSELDNIKNNRSYAPSEYDLMVLVSSKVADPSKDYIATTSSSLA